jgi:hypothetical protein
MWILKINFLPQIETTSFESHLQAMKEMEGKGKKTSKCVELT